MGVIETENLKIRPEVNKEIVKSLKRREYTIIKIKM